MELLQSHRHDYEEKEGMLSCKYCEKKKLILKSINEDLRIGVKSDNRNYTVRKDRRRYFFPNEWEKFYDSLTKDKHKALFLTLLHTGARIMEALHLKAGDIDFERNVITFRVIKNRTAKKNTYAIGKKRTFFVSSKYVKLMKKYIYKNKIDSNDYIFMDKNNLPSHYEELSNGEKRKYYTKKIASYHQLLKRKLKKIGIKDYYNFSLHNIRKTYGNWIRLFDIETHELCYRMGHDLDTYLAHYGSSLIFTENEIIHIKRIMGEVK